MRHTTPRLTLVAGLAVGSLALAGCAASDTSASTGDDASGISIVASTNVYGSIAEAIGGDLVTVTSLITSAAQDPHSFEASAQDQLTLSKADLVIENGGGYDPFIDTLLSASSTDVPVVNASEASGLLEGDAHTDEEHGEGEGGDASTGSATEGGDASTGSATEGEAEHVEGDGHDHIEGFNEHIWYSFHGVEHVAEEIAHQLSELDADNASTYEANYAAFAAEIETLEATAEGMHATTEGLGAAITEPVPLYLLEAAGFTNKTPEAFSEAIEEGTDVAPAVLAETLELFTAGSVSLLAYNGQTASSETERVRTAAEENDVAVVEFTETLPDGADYVSWMTDNLSAISAALK